MRKLILAASLIFTLAFVAGTATAKPAKSWGPELGSTIPDQLESLDQDGKKQSFSSLVGDKGVALVFVRSLDWCGFCKKQAKELGTRVDDFTQRGFRPVVMSYDPVATLKTFQAKHAPSLTFLSDPESRVIQAFGILNQHEKPGSRGYGIPNPGIIIIDRNGVIRAKFAEKSYRDRPKIDTVLAAIDELDL